MTSTSKPEKKPANGKIDGNLHAISIQTIPEIKRCGIPNSIIGEFRLNSKFYAPSNSNCIKKKKNKGGGEKRGGGKGKYKQKKKKIPLDHVSEW